MPRAAATSSASMVLPVPGSPLMSSGRCSVMDAFTARRRSSLVFGGWFIYESHRLYTRDPNAPDFTIPELSLTGDISATRLAGREHLFSTLERRPVAEALPAPSLQMSRFQERAFDLLNSNQTQQAFRLQDESDAVRDRYGRNIYGQSTLLARRLIEAGTRLVTVSWAPDANATWDTHGSNFKKLRGELLPQLDPERFWQVHRGTVVRCDAVATALRDDAGKVTLTLRGHADRLTVSRLYAHRFKPM